MFIGSISNFISSSVSEAVTTVEQSLRNNLISSTVDSVEAVALNPQPLPPAPPDQDYISNYISNFFDEVALNPQPLPPNPPDPDDFYVPLRDSNVSDAVALNSQPKPGLTLRTRTLLELRGSHVSMRGPVSGTSR